MQSLSVTYKGYLLTPLVVLEAGAYASMIVVENAEHVREVSGRLGTFPSAEAARRFALETGKTEIDLAVPEQSGPQAVSDMDIAPITAPVPTTI